MTNFMYNAFNVVSLLGKTTGENATDPIYKALSTIGPYAISVTLILGILYGVILGVKFAKAESADERSKLQKVLINGIVGFVVVLVLIIILYAIRGPIVDWMNG